MPLDFYIIFLQNLRLEVSMGIHGFERQALQPIHLSAALLLPKTQKKAKAIDDVVDYDFLRQEMIRLAKSQHWDLQEGLCQAILARVACQALVLGCIVKSAKPSVYPDVQEIGCHMAYLAPHFDQSFAWWTIAF
jgi:7,8-dihydroneopterin aldolase/epimerase/oxygenase